LTGESTDSDAELNLAVPDFYHERQVGKNCTIHAFNNAIGRALLSRNIARNELVPARLVGSRNIKESDLYSEQNGFSIDILQSLYARKRTGYKVQQVPSMELVGSYILMGYSERSNSRHAVAVRNGYFIDSESDRILDLRYNPIPAYFRKMATFRVSRDSPDRPSPPDPVIDLTTD